MQGLSNQFILTKVFFLKTTGSITLATERESEVTKLLNLERHINKEEKFKFCKDSEKGNVLNKASKLGLVP